MMGGYTSFAGFYTYNDVDAVISPTGLVFKLYRDHQGDIPLTVTGNSPRKESVGTVGVDKPSEVSGSPTWPLDVMATKDSATGRVTVSIVNTSSEAQELNLVFDGAKMAKKMVVYTLVSENLNDTNTPEDPDKVRLESSVEKVRPTFTVGARSITLIEIDPA